VLAPTYEVLVDGGDVEMVTIAFAIQANVVWNGMEWKEILCGSVRSLLLSMMILG
jgi:hypothetical protein